MMRWHCIVRGKSCSRDVPGQGKHGLYDDEGPAAGGQWQMTPWEHNDELEVTVLLSIWS